MRHLVCIYPTLGGATRWAWESDSFALAWLLFTFSRTYRDESILWDDRQTGKQRKRHGQSRRH